MKNFVSILVSALALTLIAGVATAALAFTNAQTKDVIAESNARAANEARRAVFSSSSSYSYSSSVQLYGT